LIQFNEAIELMQSRPLSNLEKQGLIQAFEFTHELAWKTLQDYFRYQGAADLYGSRDVFRKALEVGLISEGEKWFESIQSRNLTSHVYDEHVVQDLIEEISGVYARLLNELNHALNRL
jgi:nucleotidyltransferase substrate binding protein (TIGR01987 family)